MCVRVRVRRQHQNTGMGILLGLAATAFERCHHVLARCCALQVWHVLLAIAPTCVCACVRHPVCCCGRFVVVQHGLEERRTPGNTLAVQPDKPYQGLSMFGTGEVAAAAAAPRCHHPGNDKQC